MPAAQVTVEAAIREVETLFGPEVKDADLLKVLEIARRVRAVMRG